MNDLVRRFILAFNAGDQGALQQLFTRGDGWDWYSTDGPEARINRTADDREGLGAYFMRRHAAHEAMRLRSFQFNGINGAFGEFQFTLNRQADDMAPTKSAGKGSVACATSPITIGTWSMARDAAAQSVSTAPAPSEPPPAPQRSRAFRPTGLQVVEVAHLKGLIVAFDAGDVRAAISQFSRTQALGFSDCDYSTQMLVDGHGRAALTAWLRRSFADHDRLTIGDIEVFPPDKLGVLGVAFSRRSGDAITRGGHPSGITPSPGAKIKFDNAGLITEFNNGPYGAQDACRL